MKLRFREPYVTPEQLRSILLGHDMDFVFGDPNAKSCQKVLASFGHLVLDLYPSTELDTLTGILESAVDHFVTTREGERQRFINRVPIDPQQSQLCITTTNRLPISMPYRITGSSELSTGVFLKLTTSNTADYVALGALPAWEFNRYDGSLMPEMGIHNIMVAPTATNRARRLCRGILPHLVSRLSADTV